MTDETLPERIYWQFKLVPMGAEEAHPSVHFTRARLYVRKLEGVSYPHHLHCADGLGYIVKSAGVAHSSIIDEHIVGRLGRIIGAPVANIAIIDVPSHSFAGQDGMEEFHFGWAHGSEIIHEPVVDSYEVQYVNRDGNRERFALLTVLYALCCVDDIQFLYGRQEPHRVYFADHGYPCTATWEGRVNRSPVLNPKIIGDVQLSYQEQRRAVYHLRRLTDDLIAEVISSVPVVWGITDDQRIDYAQLLKRNRDLMLKSYRRLKP